MTNEAPNKSGCFWAIVSYTLIAVFFVLMAISAIGPRRGDRPLASQIAYGAVLITLVLVVWAICFRAQLEARRVSLVAIFALVTMLAALFSAFRYFDPLRIYTG